VTVALAYFGTYDPTYPRTAVLLAGLRELGVTVHESNAPLPPLEAAAMATPRGAGQLAAGVLAAHARLLVQHRAGLRVDAVVAGYPGHLVVPFARLVAAWHRVPLVVDPLVSLWDTFAGDRSLVSGAGAPGAVLRVADRLAFGLPRLVLADTAAHARAWGETFALRRDQMAVVPVGALPEPQADGSARTLEAGEPLVVFQYGKWSPLHGADVVLGAAGRLRDEPVRLVLAGEGQLSERLTTRIAAEGLRNVEWLGRLTPAALRARTLAADVCLGVFGSSAKAGRVVPNKVHDALACGRPVVTADSEAARELLHDGETALLVPPGDADALAGAVRRLRDQAEREALGAAALALYRRRLTPARIAADLLTALEGVR
jgi:glycosyltransferase involved in cell wall biosynthesis